VVIADDGSGRDTAKLDRGWKGAGSARRSNTSGTSIRDFSRREIRNRGILASGGAYCIFLDGDCLARSILSRGIGVSRAGLVRPRQSGVLMEQLTARCCGSNSSRSDGGSVDWIGQHFSGGLKPAGAAAESPARPCGN